MGFESARVSDSIKFGNDFELDVYTYELRRSGRLLKLERIPTELLLLLVERRGQIVSREQIVERIWGRGIFLDTDNSINGAIRKIRQVLKDDPEYPRFVQTITGKGYRFIAPVVEPSTEHVSEDVALTSRTASDVGPPRAGGPEAFQPVPRGPSPVVESQISKPLRRHWLTILVIAVVVIVAVGAYLRWFQPARSQPVARRMMLAVLPFTNLTGDSAEDYSVTA